MDINNRNYAQILDEEDDIKHLRDEFLIPSRADVAIKQGAKLPKVCDDQCIYLCGNSLGLQPRQTNERITQALKLWASQGVQGYFRTAQNSTSPPWLCNDEAAASAIAPLVGALSSEVAVMQTLTANLHFLMCSFYQPTKEKYKVILESNAFPTDHYAIESQIRSHKIDPSDALIFLQPEQHLLKTEQILSTIIENASSVALIILPGIQYYTGQLLDIKTITTCAHAHDIIIGWDLAHVIGNVPLSLHEWKVDFAVWCHYKYVNAGPGAIGGLFVHEINTHITTSQLTFRNRLAGWWAVDKNTRFEMSTKFIPGIGARGFQLSGPSVLDITSLQASLEVFHMTDIETLRAKSIKLTGYLEALLLKQDGALFKIITPSDPTQRGAQLSIQLDAELLDDIIERLQGDGIVIDARKPNVIRITPVPLYNTFTDVFLFVQCFLDALAKLKHIE